MRSEGGGWCVPCTSLLVLFSTFLPLCYTSPPFFSFLSSFYLHRFLICFFFFLSPLSPSFFPLLLLLVFFSLCLSPLSPFPLFFFFFFFLKSTTFSSIPIFFPFFFLRELLVLCALRELLVLYASYDVIEDTIDCNQP